MPLRGDRTSWREEEGGGGRRGNFGYLLTTFPIFRTEAFPSFYVPMYQGLH